MKKIAKLKIDNGDGVTIEITKEYDNDYCGEDFGMTVWNYKEQLFRPLLLGLGHAPKSIDDEIGADKGVG